MVWADNTGFWAYYSQPDIYALALPIEDLLGTTRLLPVSLVGHFQRCSVYNFSEGAKEFFH